MKYEYIVYRFKHYFQDESGLNEEDLINSFAKDNWELISTQLFNESYTYLYFKRQVDGKD